MSALTFTQVLRSEIARMQSLHPEREGELARAHALIMQGMVVPTDDPATAHVLSSDGQKRYTVNGSCECSAGQHGKACKHMHAWKLYQYIVKKVQAQAPPDQTYDRQFEKSLPEARASLNFKALIGNFETQITLRSDTEEDLLTRLQVLLKRQDIRPVPKPAPKTGNWKRSNQGR
jgi:hypothetical protein